MNLETWTDRFTFKRELDAVDRAGARFRVVLEFVEPEPDPDDDGTWMCRGRLVGIREALELSPIRGVDPLHALLQAIAVIERVLTSRAQEDGIMLSWQGRSDLGLVTFPNIGADERQ